MVIDELELLPGQQIRSARQNSLNFASLTPGTFTGTALTSASGIPGAAGATADGQAPADGIEAAGKVIDLFNKLRNK